MKDSTILIAVGVAAAAFLFRDKLTGFIGGAVGAPPMPGVGPAGAPVGSTQLSSLGSLAASMAGGMFGKPPAGTGPASGGAVGSPGVKDYANAALDKWNDKGKEMCASKGVPPQVCGAVGDTITKAQKYAVDKAAAVGNKVVDKFKSWF